MTTSCENKSTIKLLLIEINGVKKLQRKALTMPCGKCYSSKSTKNVLRLTISFCVAAMN